MLTEGLFALMNGCTPLTNIVGTNIFPVVLPKSPPMPAVTFVQVSSHTLVTFNKTEISTDLIELNCWGNTYHDAAYAQAALHTLLDMYQGTLSEGTVVMYTSSTDNPDDFEKDSLLYRCRTTYSFVYR
jgi:hypothetical protein